MKKINESKNSKKFNATVDKVNEEMEYALNYTSNWRVRWNETYSDVYCYDMQFLSSDDIGKLTGKYRGLYNLSRYWDDSKREGQALKRVTLEDDNGEEYRCEFRKAEWVLLNTKLARAFTFRNTGKINYVQMKRKRTADDMSYDYYADYDVNSNDVSLRFVNYDEDICFMNSDLRQYAFGNKSIFEDEERITITENHDDREQIEIVLDRAGKVLMKYVTSGDYVYIIEGDDIVSYTCGGEQQEITEEVLGNLKELMSTYELNNISDSEYFEYVNQIKTKIINAIKGVKGDVPLTGLSRRLDIALSMISTKRIVPVEEKRELKKRK